MASSRVVEPSSTGRHSLTKRAGTTRDLGVSADCVLESCQDDGRRVFRQQEMMQSTNRNKMSEEGLSPMQIRGRRREGRRMKRDAGERTKKESRAQQSWDVAQAGLGLTVHETNG